MTDPYAISALLRGLTYPPGVTLVVDGGALMLKAEIEEIHSDAWEVRLRHLPTKKYVRILFSPDAHLSFIAAEVRAAAAELYEATKS